MSRGRDLGDWWILAAMFVLILGILAALLVLMAVVHRR